MCASVCRKNAITMVESPEGFLYPYIDVDKCVECHECEKKCPAILCAVRNPESDFYMGWHKDKDVLLSSSSGGIFTAIADYIFDNGGVVFGVVTVSYTHLGAGSDGILSRRTASFLTPLRVTITVQRFVTLMEIRSGLSTGHCMMLHRILNMASA